MRGKLVKQFYLFGAVIPYVFFIDYFLDYVVSLPDFVTARFANGAVGVFTADLQISSAVLWADMVIQRELKIWLSILLNMTISLTCALPAYLYTVVGRREAAGEWS